MTRRLVLSELGEGDAAFIHDLMTDPDWLSQIGDRGVRSVDDARGYLCKHLVPPYRQQGFGLWRVGGRRGGEPMGICGLVRRESLPAADIGYAFLPEWRGQGYALEAAQAVVRHARDSLGMERLLAICSPGNTASIRLLLALGMREARPDDGVDPLSDSRCLVLDFQPSA